MPDPRFVGLVHSVLASAQASLGEEHSPMGRHLDRDGVRSRRTAERSLALLEMLHDKTAGNLDETERAALHDAIERLRAGLRETADVATSLPMHDPDARP